MNKKNNEKIGIHSYNITPCYKYKQKDNAFFSQNH